MKIEKAEDGRCSAETENITISILALVQTDREIMKKKITLMLVLVILQRDYEVTLLALRSTRMMLVEEITLQRGQAQCE